MSRTEQIIEEIEEYIDGCKYQTFSNTNIIVNKEEMEELLGELRLRVPDEIKKYQKIVSNQDAILADARAQAQNMISDASAQIDELVNDHEVMKRAYERANEVIAEAQQKSEGIINSAIEDANGIRMSAIQYTDQLLENVQNIISSAVADSQRMYQSETSMLQQIFDQCGSNRSSLQQSIAQSAGEEPAV